MSIPRKEIQAEKRAQAEPKERRQKLGRIRPQLPEAPAKPGAHPTPCPTQASAGRWPNLRRAENAKPNSRGSQTLPGRRANARRRQALEIEKHARKTSQAGPDADPFLLM